jgi:hypothetical protein
MTRAEKNLWQHTATFEPLWNGQHGLIPRKKPTAKNDDGLMSKNSRGDWTRLELFVEGVRLFWDPRLAQFAWLSP